MMNLFKNIYIDLDRTMDLFADRVVISEKHGYPLLDSDAGQYPSELIAYGTTVEDLLAQKNYNSVSAFLKSLSDRSNKVIIYCDSPAYQTLLTYWYKLVFPNITNESAHTLIETTLLKYHYISGPFWSPNAHIYVNSIPQKEEYNSLFSSTVDSSSDAVGLASEISNMSDEHTIEFLMASYFYNASHKEELRAVMYDRINRILNKIYKHLWKKLCSSLIMRKSIRDQLNVTITTDPLTELKLIERDPVFQNFLIIVNANENKTLDLSELTDEQIADIKAKADVIAQALLVNNSPGMLDRLHSYIDIVRSGLLTDENLEKIINYELYPPENMFGFTNLMFDKSAYNPYILEYAYEAKRNNQLELLAPYLLR
jgi:hypothetical protein